jgi:hypothetical protein
MPSATAGIVEKAVYLGVRSLHFFRFSIGATQVNRIVNTIGKDWLMHEKGDPKTDPK